MTQTVVVPQRLPAAPPLPQQFAALTLVDRSPRPPNTDLPATTPADRHRADVTAAQQLIVDTAALGVPGAVWVSITVPAGRAFQTTCSSNDVALAIDEMQYVTGEGPCLTTASGAVDEIYSTDLAHDLRWPNLGRSAARGGVGSVLSFQLLDRQRRPSGP